jgi:plastocyanin
MRGVLANEACWAVLQRARLGTTTRTSRERRAEIVKLRRRYVPLVAVLGVAAAVLPAIASSETSPTVEAVNVPANGYSEETHSWSPSQVTVMASGVVTFRNSTEVPHGVEWRSAIKPSCEEGPGKVPVGTTEAASGTKWSGTCTFTQPGAYTFWCTVHHAKMAGTITVNANGTTTTTTTPTTTTITTTPTTPVEPPSGSPLVRSPTLRSSQRGGSLKGSLDISKAGAGDRLEIDVFARSASLAKVKHSTRVRVGRLVRSSVSAGKVSFVVKLSAKARSALKRHHRLALTVKITLTPFYSEPTTVTRSVVEHG